MIGFQLVRDIGDWKYLVRYHGKLESNTILGTIEVIHNEGGDAVKLVVLQPSEMKRWGSVGRKQFSLRSDTKEGFDEAVLRPHVIRRHRGNLAFA